MVKIKKIVSKLNSWIPLFYAQNWDNVGMLVMADNNTDVKKIMSCVTINSFVVDEAVEKNINLIITHHPVMFDGMKKLSIDDLQSGLVIKLIKNNISVYCAHTAYDNVPDEGINDQVLLNVLQPASFNIDYLIENKKTNDLVNANNNKFNIHIGSARYATIKRSSNDKITSFKNILDKSKILYTGFFNNYELSSKNSDDLRTKLRVVYARNIIKSIKNKQLLDAILSETQIKTVATCCGVGSSFVDRCIEINCDLYITGELRYHECLQLSEHNCNVILAGHFSSEKFAMDNLCKKLQSEFNDIDCIISTQDQCPVSIF